LYLVATSEAGEGNDPGTTYRVRAIPPQPRIATASTAPAKDMIYKIRAFFGIIYLVLRILAMVGGSAVALGLGYLVLDKII